VIGEDLFCLFEVEIMMREEEREGDYPVDSLLFQILQFFLNERFWIFIRNEDEVRDRKISLVIFKEFPNSLVSVITPVWRDDEKANPFCVDWS
jgi:hypothetical protein